MLPGPTDEEEVPMLDFGALPPEINSTRMYAGVAAAAGLGIALPSVDYLAALAVILASGAPVMTQLGALLMFNVIAFSLVEIPLVAYLLAPTATRAAMTALQDWIRSRRRIEVAALLVAVGLVLLAAGLADL